MITVSLTVLSVVIWLGLQYLISYAAAFLMVRRVRT